MKPEYVSIKAHLIRELAKKYKLSVPEVGDDELVAWFQAFLKQHTENDDE